MKHFVLSVAVILFALTACSPAPESTSRFTDNRDRLQLVQKSGKTGINADKISSDIVGRAVQISELTGAGPDDKWTFESSEPRQVNILEERATGTELTLVIFMTTRSIPKPDEEQIQVSGKLRLHYERSAGKWLLKTIENLTFRYSVGIST